MLGEMLNLASVKRGVYIAPSWRSTVKISITSVLFFPVQVWIMRLQYFRSPHFRILDASALNSHDWGGEENQTDSHWFFQNDVISQLLPSNHITSLPNLVCECLLVSLWMHDAFRACWKMPFSPNCICTVLIGSSRNRWVPTDFDKWSMLQTGCGFFFWCVIDTKILLLFW